MSTVASSTGSKLPAQIAPLAWLADAPLFIDRQQVEAFYDAVVQPEGEHTKIVLSLEKYKEWQAKVEGKAKLKLGASDLIKLFAPLFPFIKAEAEVEADGSGAITGGKREAETIEIRPIKTPQRQLVQLAFHYLANQPERLVMLQGTAGEIFPPPQSEVDDEAFILDSPRALAFVDFGPKTKFIPMAAEVVDGRVIKVFDRLETRLEKPPPAPNVQQRSEETVEEFKARRDTAWAEYWDWFDRTFEAHNVLEIVEDVVSTEGRIQWIDFRIPRLPRDLDREPSEEELALRPLHLHICGRGEFSAGTFAYNLIKRGHTHGLRMVGTLKTKPDLNVLAIFEK